MLDNNFATSYFRHLQQLKNTIWKQKTKHGKNIVLVNNHTNTV